MYQAISLASGLALMMRIYPVSKIEEISIPKARNFAAYVPGDFPNPQLELIVVFP